MTDPIRLRSSVLSFVDSMHCHGQPITNYKLFARAEHTPFASAFAIYIKYLLGETESFSDDERNEWINYFRSYQDEETGLFCDPNSESRVVDERHDKVHLDRQLTTFCISALECLSSSSLYPLNFMNEFYDKEYFVNYLDDLNWGNAWNSGNKVMFIGICAIYNYEKFQDQESKVILDNWLEWMDANQNTDTGFWGDTTATQYFNGMGGFYHQFVIYNYLKKSVNHSQKVVDRHIYLQLRDGGFNPEGGGAACDDIDGIDPLVHFYHQHDYRRDDIKAVLKKTLDLILSSQNDDGGFYWSKHYWYNFTPYFGLISDAITKRDPYYTYLCARGLLRGQKKDFIKQGVLTGWSTLDRMERESSLFDTWLRCTTIGEICSVLDQEPMAKLKMNFLKAPGVGWFNADKSKF